MNQARANSSPDLICPSPPSEHHQFDDSALEGVAANVKLLLKLIQDHKDGCEKEKTDSRRMLRVATMMTILDNVRDRIQKSQSFGNRKSQAELRRCNTDVRRNQIPRDKRAEPVVEDEKDRLRRELSASVAARKSLQIMCSSLGKEKEIMGTELLKKVHEVTEMEELISALNAQNKTLLQKVQECASQHKGKKYSGGASGGGESQVIAALQERNKVLSEQLLKSIDGYRSMKRKLKAAQEENVMMHSVVNEMGGKAVVSLERVKSLKERVSSCSSSSEESESNVDFKEEIGALERMFEGFQMLVGKYDTKQGDCAPQREGQINACKPPSLIA